MPPPGDTLMLYWTATNHFELLLAVIQQVKKAVSVQTEILMLSEDTESLPHVKGKEELIWNYESP